MTYTQYNYYTQIANFIYTTFIHLYTVSHKSNYKNVLSVLLGLSLLTNPKIPKDSLYFNQTPKTVFESIEGTRKKNHQTTWNKIQERVDDSIDTAIASIKEKYNFNNLKAPKNSKTIQQINEPFQVKLGNNNSYTTSLIYLKANGVNDVTREDLASMAVTAYEECEYKTVKAQIRSVGEITEIFKNRKIGAMNCKYLCKSWTGSDNTSNVSYSSIATYKAQFSSTNKEAKERISKSLKSDNVFITLNYKFRPDEKGMNSKLVKKLRKQKMSRVFSTLVNEIVKLKNPNYSKIGYATYFKIGDDNFYTRRNMKIPKWDNTIAAYSYIRKFVKKTGPQEFFCVQTTNENEYFQKGVNPIKKWRMK